MVFTLRKPSSPGQFLTYNLSASLGAVQVRQLDTMNRELDRLEKVVAAPRQPPAPFMPGRPRLVH